MGGQAQRPSVEQPADHWPTGSSSPQTRSSVQQSLQRGTSLCLLRFPPSLTHRLQSGLCLLHANVGNIRHFDFERSKERKKKRKKRNEARRMEEAAQCSLCSHTPGRGGGGLGPSCSAAQARRGYWRTSNHSTSSRRSNRYAVNVVYPLYNFLCSPLP